MMYNVLGGGDNQNGILHCLVRVEPIQSTYPVELPLKECGLVVCFNQSEWLNFIP